MTAIILAILNILAVVVQWLYDRWKQTHKYVKGIAEKKRET